MKFAPIVPTNGLRVLERVGVGYHFALGQELLRDKEYRNYYRALGRLGHFIIVDNGAAEQDVPPFEEVVKVAQQIKASEIIMPDVLADCHATMDALDNLESLLPDATAGLRRMIVPQGKTENEWFTCLEHYLDRLELQVACIGIAKHLEHHIEGGRARILTNFRHWYPRLIHKVDIHLLGVWHDPFQEISRAAAAIKPCAIRGIDSGIPVAWAQRSRSLDPSSEQPFPAFEDRIGLAWGAPFELTLAKNNIWALTRYASEY